MNIKKLDTLVEKSSNPERMKEIVDDLKKSGFDDAFNTGREIKLLPELLDNDEHVLAAASGLNSKSESILIVVTGKRILLENKKLIAGSQNTDIPLDKVNSVSYNTGIVLGKISFTNGADTITIKDIKKQNAQPLADTIKSAANDYQNKLKNNNVLNEQNSNANNEMSADKLREMKQLADDGIISQEEFDAAKKKYLGL